MFRIWPINRKLKERRSATEMFAPIIQLLFENLTLKKIALPRRIICVLDRELKKRRRLILAKCSVKGSKFIEKNRCRPCVADSVMSGQEQDMISRVESQELGADQGAAHKVERNLGLFRRNLASGISAFCFRPRRE